MSDSYISKGGEWRFAIPDGWNVREWVSGRRVTVFRPDGIGMLEISNRRPPGFTRKELENRGLYHGQLSGWYRSTLRGTTFSRIWTLQTRKAELWVSYTCSSENEKMESAEVDQIVGSISDVA